MSDRLSLYERATRTQPWRDFTVTQVTQGGTTFTAGGGMTVNEARYIAEGPASATFRILLTFTQAGSNNQAIVLSIDTTTIPDQVTTGPQQSHFTRPAQADPHYVGILTDDPGGTLGTDFIHYANRENALGTNPGGFAIASGDTWEITGTWLLDV